MDIHRFGPDDTERVVEHLEVLNAARAVDSPWEPHRSLSSYVGELRHGWDGEPVTPYVGVLGGRPVARGVVAASERDNTHLAWLGVDVHPECRRQGLGSELLERLEADARGRGRTVVGIDGWESPATAGFAKRHGYELGSVAVMRRQDLTELDWDAVEQHHDQAARAAGDYVLERRFGATPEAEIEAVAEMTAAINDAPTDGLDLEDEVFTPDKVRAYEGAQLARGNLLHRVLARHRTTGALAGQSVVVVDGELPQHAHQHDTSVVAAHRGHRLGLLLKTEMNLWLREAQPQLVHVDTWNAESNDHMIAVNEAVGYRVVAREMQYQKRYGTR